MVGGSTMGIAGRAKLQTAKGRSGPFFKADYILQIGYQGIVLECTHTDTNTRTHKVKN